MTETHPTSLVAYVVHVAAAPISEAFDSLADGYGRSWRDRDISIHYGSNNVTVAVSPDLGHYIHEELYAPFISAFESAGWEVSVLRDRVRFRHPPQATPLG